MVGGGFVVQTKTRASAAEKVCKLASLPRVETHTSALPTWQSQQNFNRNCDTWCEIPRNGCVVTDGYHWPSPTTKFPTKICWYLNFSKFGCDNPSNPNVEPRFTHRIYNMSRPSGAHKILTQTHWVWASTLWSFTKRKLNSTISSFTKLGALNL
jgi:hypothetical protein